MIQDEPEGRPIYNVPVAPPSYEQRSIPDSWYAGEFVRDPNVWAVGRPYLEGMAGTGPSITGRAAGDEWYMTQKLQDMASQNGHAALADWPPDRFRMAVRRAYRSMTGDAIGKLIKQGNRLRIEDRRAHKEAAE